MAGMKNRYRGCLVGLAVGDALGYPVEFLNGSELRAKYGPAGITDFVTHHGQRGLYSDDTQMTLAVARALLAANLNSLDDIMRHVRDEFVAWSVSPENNRAPGVTCMNGAQQLQAGVHWFSSGDPYSKGNGAAMRAAPIGLLFSKRPQQLIDVSRAIALCTHAHPTGVSSAIAAAAAVAYVVEGGAPAGLIAHLKKVLRFARGPDGYHEVVSYDPLGEQITRLDDAQRALDEGRSPDTAFDLIGAGWVGEEAVAGACFAYLKDPKRFENAVLIGANAAQTDEAGRSRGKCDSDSIACIAGSISGAALGLEAVPTRWVNGIENRDLLLATADELFAKAV